MGVIIEYQRDLTITVIPKPWEANLSFDLKRKLLKVQSLLQ